MAHIFSWSKRLLFFLHRITRVTPRHGGSSLLDSERVTRAAPRRRLGGCWILLNTTGILRKQKPLLIRHFDLILLKLSGRLASFLAYFSKVTTVLVFASPPPPPNRIQVTALFLFTHSVFFCFPHFFLFSFSRFCNCK